MNNAFGKHLLEYRCTVPRCRQERPVTGPPFPFLRGRLSCSLILAHNQETPKPPAAAPTVQSVLSGQDLAPNMGLTLTFV